MKAPQLKLFGLASLAIGALFTLATLAITQLYGPADCGYRTESATGVRYTLHGCEAERAGWPLPFISIEIIDFIVDDHTANIAPNGTAVSSRFKLDSVWLLADLILASGVSFGALVGFDLITQRSPARRRK